MLTAAPANLVSIDERRASTSVVAKSPSAPAVPTKAPEPRSPDSSAPNAMKRRERSVRTPLRTNASAKVRTPATPEALSTAPL